jgi:ribosomal protein L37AE/L43A
MCPQELRRRLHAVDPNLNIVGGGTHKKKRSSEWEKAGGFFCSECRQETVRLKEITPGRWACPECYRKYAEKFAKTEACLESLTNSKDPGQARRARRYLMKRLPS